MNNFLPESYVIDKFLEYGYAARHERGSSTYNCGCPICHEGSSFGKKKRCYYIPKTNRIFCHNCGWSSDPFTWIQEVSGMTPQQIYAESQNYEFIPTEIHDDKFFNNVKRCLDAANNNYDYTLPEDSVNLSGNSTQLDFYKSNSIVRKCLDYIKERRLDCAINRPHAFYVSLAEGGHKGRLLIPFCDENGNIVYYQSRAIGASHNLDLEKVKYLSKKNVSKTLFGVERVDPEMENVYILEGPIDACFVKNGIALAGITKGEGNIFCESQEAQKRALMLNHNFVWILDNPWVDETARKRTEWLLRNGEQVFFWPKELSAYKDINDYCVANKVDEFPLNIIEENIIYGENASSGFIIQMNIQGLKV